MSYVTKDGYSKTAMKTTFCFYDLWEQGDEGDPPPSIREVATDREVAYFTARRHLLQAAEYGWIENRRVSGTTWGIKSVRSFHPTDEGWRRLTAAAKEKNGSRT